MITIVDYGLGNLRSVQGAVEKLGMEARISSDEAELKTASKLILPGVGAFGDGMKNLRSRELIEPLNYCVHELRTPLLGICLGAQLLAKESFEFGHHEGLGWINATVERFEVDPELRVPHVGWNDLAQTKGSLLWEGVPENALFYYVHSFHIVPVDNDDVIGTCNYGINFVGALQRGNVFATQFHPEKSQLHGLQVLKNFLQRT